MAERTDYEKSMARAHKAMSLLIERGCPATPQYFELWYNYVDGMSPELIKEVDNAIGADGTLAPQEADRILGAFLATRVDSEEIQNVSTQMQGEMDEVVTLIEGALGQSSEYGRSLDDVSEALDSDPDADGMRSVLKRLVTSTREMEHYNQQLETRLHVSRQQITELSQCLEMARNESRTDQLCGISNRKAFDEFVARIIKEAEAENFDVCLLMGDIDRFKNFNDTYGHQTGDQVLRLVAACMKAVVKGGDFPARYGGEEFAIVLPETSLKNAVIVANHVRETVMSKKLIKKSTGEDLGIVTISFGVAKYRFGEGVNEWIHRADACLYAAKHDGRNMVKCETDPDINLDMSAA